MTIRGVTWVRLWADEVPLDPNPDEAALHYFTPILPEGYVLESDWICLPEIAVFIGEMGETRGVVAFLSSAGVTTVSDYAILQEAITSGSYSTIRLGGNISGSTQLTISRDLTLDLSGHELTINVTGNYNGIRINSNVTLTIMDSVGVGTLNVTGTASSSTGTGAAINTTAGTLIIQSGTVNATGGWQGAGIGGGLDGAGGIITIYGGTVTAEGGGGGAGIGGGWRGAGGTITISGNAKVNATGNVSAGIGGGQNGEGGYITIDGGTVNATGGIGGGQNGAGGVITIDGGTVNATGGHNGAGIGGGQNGAGGVITISGNANVTAYGGGGINGGAGIGGGAGIDGGAGNITISGNSNVTATGGSGSSNNGGAGIGGGGHGGAGGYITINGGSVTAIAGGSGNSAAVGRGNSGVDGTVRIIGTFYYWASATTTPPNDKSGPRMFFGETGHQLNSMAIYELRYIKLKETTPFVPVTNITGVPSTGTVGTPVALSGTVVPNNATNREITWSLGAGSTAPGAAVNANQANATGAGTVVVTATVINGAGIATDFTRDFSITFSDPPPATIAPRTNRQATGTDTINLPEAIGPPINITDTASSAVITFNGNFVDLYAVSIDGNALTLTPTDGGRKILLSGFPGFDGNVGNAVSGSTIITLYSEFLQTLPNGTYTLTLSFRAGDGQAPYVSLTTTFVINRPEADGDAPPPEDSAEGDAPGNQQARAPTPQTGDDRSMILHIIALSLGAACIIGAEVHRRRSKM